MEPAPMIVVERYASADEARRMAASLVERGVGATVEPVEPTGPVEPAGPAGIDPVPQWAVTVMPDDRARARELLGLPPDAGPSEDGDDAGGLTRSVRGMLLPVLIAIVVLVTVPLIAFFVSFKLSGG
ncbi:MAG TPA: hypothetical protein VMT43_02375 [Acidimicrobiales bacterium]|nr:hypothetical protein [Acidimicrobiales bacterium]